MRYTEETLRKRRSGGGGGGVDAGAGRQEVLRDWIFSRMEILPRGKPCKAQKSVTYKFQKLTRCTGCPPPLPKTI